MRTKKQKNTASKNIHLEPHIWVCEDVKILKGIYIGACSIIGAAALVTRDVPRFSRCYGSPAKSVVDETTFWSINDNKKSIKRAIHYTKKYQKLELSHPWSS
jgi:acetyltransferase-like isoleucine patch superfamily enzyme